MICWLINGIVADLHYYVIQNYILSREMTAPKDSSFRQLASSSDEDPDNTLNNIITEDFDNTLNNIATEASIVYCIILWQFSYCVFFL